MNHEYGRHNYIELSCMLPWRMGFVYVDSASHIADRIFINRQIPVKFTKDFVKDTCPYIYVFCKIRKKNRSAFLEAMVDLERKMLLTGHDDYSDYCRQEFQSIFDDA